VLSRGEVCPYPGDRFPCPRRNQPHPHVGPVNLPVFGDALVVGRPDGDEHCVESDGFPVCRGVLGRLGELVVAGAGLEVLDFRVWVEAEFECPGLAQDRQAVDLRSSLLEDFPVHDGLYAPGDGGRPGPLMGPMVYWVRREVCCAFGRFSRAVRYR